MTKRFISPVENEKVALRLLEENDLPLTLSWRNQENIRRWFFTTDIVSFENHLAWFKRYRELDTDFVFIILSKELNLKPVGQISLYSINWQTRIGEYGRLMIGEAEARGKGLARSASLLLLQVGFEILGLREIVLEVKQDNLPAIAVYRSVGFQQSAFENGVLKMKITHHQSKHAKAL
jgi:RimJ/RimL family protein N-acetyltransferase